MIEQAIDPQTAQCGWERRARALEHVMGALRPEVGLHSAVETVLRQMAGLAAVGRATIVLHDEVGNSIIRWDYEAANDAEQNGFAVTEPPITDWQTYFFETPSILAYAGPEPWPGAETATVPARLRYVLPCRSLACVDFSGKSTRGRLFLPDLTLDRTTREHLAWIRETLPGLTLALGGLARLRRMRRRAERDERARLGRELHDGPIQAFIAIRLQLEALMRREGRNSDMLVEIDGWLQDAIEGLRAVSDRARAGVLPPTAAIPVLRQLVERFTAETGIATEFQSDVESLRVSPRTAYELVAIVREALVNVERHSHATAVSVQMSQRDGVCWLRVDDNGRGFRVLGSEGQGPRIGSVTPSVIAERVSAIGGMLAVGSSPANGGRVEVTFPGAESE